MTDPTRRLAPVVRLAPAKLNLTLAIVGRRPDGYHALHSVMVPLGLADRLSLAIQADGEDSLHSTGFDPGPAADNIVLKAVSAARQALRGAAVATPPLAIRLDKQIPGCGRARRRIERRCGCPRWCRRSVGRDPRCGAAV